MSGENWTPGLWLKTDNHTIYALNEGGTNRFQCQVQPGWVNGLDIKRDDERTSVDELEAVANVMTASPKLYWALKKAVQYIPEQVMYCNGDKCREPWCGSCNSEDDAEMAVGMAQAGLNQARAALAKARGETDE